jgi:hypothetical protein
LIIAVNYAYYEMVNLLVRYGANPNLKDRDGETALMTAVEKGYTAIVRLLLIGGADPNAQNGDGNTALMIAAKGNLEMVALLLQKGALTNVRNMHGDTALMSAAMSGNPDIVKALLRNMSDPNLKNDDGKTALEMTDSEEIKQLLDAQSALYKAILGEDIQYIKGLLVSPKNIQSRYIAAQRYVTGVMYASATGRARIVKLFVEYLKLSSDVSLLVPLLQQAAINGQSEVVDYLLNLLKPSLVIPEKRALLQDEIREILKSIEEKFGISIFGENVPFCISNESMDRIKQAQLSPKGLLSTIRLLYGLLLKPTEARILEIIGKAAEQGMAVTCQLLASLGRH